MPRILAAQSPWDEARKVRLIRHEPWKDQVLEPGVNFFILALQALGSRTEFSCEGHPEGFYVVFCGPYELALRLRNCGFFRVEVEGEDRWSLRLPDQGSDASLQQTMRWAASQWASKLFSKPQT